MPIVQLSAQFVKEAVCPPDKKKVDYYDSAIKGFILETRLSGGKTFHLRYRDNHSKLRQYKIGDASAISFDKARQQAQRLRSQTVLGESPMEGRKALRQVPTVAEFVTDIYIPHIKLHRRNIQSTLSFLKHHLLPRFGAKHMEEITADMISKAQEDLRAKGYSAAQADKMPVLFKIIFNLAKKKNTPGVQSNPAADVKLFNADNARERYLSTEETLRLQEALERGENEQMKYIVNLLLMFGCRKRELLEAKWEDFDLERRNWHIPMSKSGKPRNVPISMKALELLKTLPRWKGCPYVVPNPATKKPFGNLYYPWEKVRQAAGLPDVRMHDLRHTFASNLVNSGQPIFVVSKLLGHTQIKTTMRYSHLGDDTLLSAVDMAAQLANPAEKALKSAQTV
ncbi:site-specific integrase [Acidovorax sp. Root70]|uniref:site-specific integrase n=1 Tax=Acidovorax sp. Root70 TaxID=1736590 RepID=UPI0007002CB2|nr:site-specific integrase [Acidovorax sp. Root70]KRB27955.1 integrase [Acidovorax sp. Root70]